MNRLRTPLALFVALTAMLSLASLYTPPHPSPADDDSVPLGNDTKWVSTIVQNTGTDEAMTYSAASNTFGTHQVVEQAVWTTHCPAGTTCSTNTAPYLGGFTPGKTTTIGDVHCTSVVTGSTGSLSVVIYDVSSAAVVCTCALTCENFDRVGTTGCSCVGDLAATKHHVLYVSGDCVVDPSDIICQVNLL